tara:strand:+ start:121865 stop:123214 length:1350 start_codon:yes stop_codon:yes gene_type:complete
LKQALELFNEKSYLRAEKEFLARKSEDLVQANKYLFLISSKLKKQDLPVRFNEYLSNLFELKDRKEFLKIIREHPRIEVSSTNWEALLVFLWDEGDLNGFDLWSNKIWTKVIDKKLYNHSKTIFNLLKERRPFELSNYLCYLACLVDIGDEPSQAQIVSSVLELTKSSKLKSKGKKIDQLKGLTRVQNLLSTTSETSIELELEYLRLSRAIHLLEGSSLKKSFLLEYIVMFKDSLKDLALLLENELLEDRLALVNSIKESPDLYRNFTSLPSSLKALLSSSIPKEKSIKVEEKNERFVYDLADSKPKSESNKKSYLCGPEEKELIVKIKAKDEEMLSNYLEVAQSLVGIGFLEAANELLKLQQTKAENAYLKSHVLEELGRYYELRDFVEELVGDEKIYIEDKTPYYYLLGIANLELGDKEKSLVAFKEVFGADPNYRDIQELIARAQS